MTRGTILDAARTDSRGFLGAAFVLFIVCGAVVALNWKYVYNFLAGPFPFDQRLSDAPGAREFVRAEGPALPTGMVQETTFRLLRGLAETKSVSANYLAMLEGGRILVVKVRPEFSGNVVEGSKSVVWMGASGTARCISSTTRSLAGPTYDTSRSVPRLTSESIGCSRFRMARDARSYPRRL